MKRSKFFNFFTKTKHLSIRKNIFVISSIFLLFTIIGLFCFIYHQNVNNKNLKAEIIKLENKIEDRNEKKVVSNLLAAVDSFKVLETYLNDRIVDTLYTSIYDLNDIGGKYFKDTASLLNLDYDNILSTKSHIENMLTKIREIPFGLPSFGRLSCDFGIRNSPFGNTSKKEFHPGLDIAGPYKSEVKSTADGEVLSAAYAPGYGNRVIIQHAHGYKTLYGHLAKLKVVNGQKIKTGDVVGLLGSTGRSTGPHVHYEISLNDKRVDPKNYLCLDGSVSIKK